MVEKDPEVGDLVFVQGVIQSLEEGVAVVALTRTWPLGIAVPVQCGALTHDERAANAAGGVPG